MTPRRVINSLLCVLTLAGVAMMAQADSWGMLPATLILPGMLFMHAIGVSVGRIQMLRRMQQDEGVPYHDYVAFAFERPAKIFWQETWSG